MEKMTTNGTYVSKNKSEHLPMSTGARYLYSFVNSRKVISLLLAIVLIYTFLHIFMGYTFLLVYWNMSTNRFLSFMAYISTSRQTYDIKHWNSNEDEQINNINVTLNISVVPLIQEEITIPNIVSVLEQSTVASSSSTSIPLSGNNSSLCSKCHLESGNSNYELLIDQSCLDGIELYLNNQNDTTVNKSLIPRESGTCDLHNNNNEAMSLLNISIHTMELNETHVKCPFPSPLLIGGLDQSKLSFEYDWSFKHLANKFANLGPGGAWRPENCESTDKIAIIIPFRDRQAHLKRLIEYLIPLLKRQYLAFCFIVTEQCGDDLFNKGRIMNAAARFAAQVLNVDCLVFHDVDLFPQNDGNYYGCPKSKNAARHIGGYVNSLNYEIWYHHLVGGVVSISVDNYLRINGYSNLFWGWGGEDDDFGYRLVANNLIIERPDISVGKMTMLSHVHRTRSAPSEIFSLLKTSKERWRVDGINNTQWTIQTVTVNPLYFHLCVNVGEVPKSWKP